MSSTEHHATDLSGRESSLHPGILVVDPVGDVFGRLCDLGLQASLWRVLDATRVSVTHGMNLAVIATYGPVDWTAVESIVKRLELVILSTTYDRDEAVRSLARGLAGYLDASLAPDALERALRGAIQGQPGYSRDAIGSWIHARQQRAAPALQASPLTPRQRQIVRLIAQGATDKEIAGALGIATATAQKHVTNILERLSVPNRAAAVAAVSGAEFAA